MTNQTPEEKARDNIDKMLTSAGWVVQPKKKWTCQRQEEWPLENIRQTSGLLIMCCLWTKKPVGIIEAKRVEEGEKITVTRRPVGLYAKATLKYNLNDAKLPFVMKVPAF